MRLVHTALTVLVVMSLALTLHADVLDSETDPVPVLSDLAEQLDGLGVDVLYSHASEAGQVEPSFGDRPRVAPLLGFTALEGSEVDLDRYGRWLDAFEAGARGAIAAVPSEAPGRLGHDAFTPLWEEADDGDRIVVTFAAADTAIAERIAGLLEEKGYAVYLAVADPDRESLDPQQLGELFVQADHVLTIDTVSARMNAIIQFEADLLAELKRQRDWVSAGAKGLPPIRRGSMEVVEMLGALPMEVLPGGIVLGLPPTLDASLRGATMTFDGSDYGIRIGDNAIVMEQVSEETREAVRSFVKIADSHSVVDIAGGRVTLATPFDDTRIGQRMADADREPFDHMSVRGAQKSLLVDQGVHLRRLGDRLAADVALEARFYRRDDDGHARRLVTVHFTVEDALGQARLREMRWTRHTDTRIDFDGGGADGMIDDLDQLAIDAAIIAVARLNSGT